MTYVKLVNFLGVYLAMKLYELELDLSKGNNRLIILAGLNGSGKTTIMDSLTLFSDIYRSRKDNTFILEGKDGLKEIHIEHKGCKYISRIYYLQNKTRCEFKKINGTTEEDLNPTCLVKSYEEALFNEFGLEPHHNKLLYIGQDLTNVVKLSPSERKNFIGAFLPHIEEYLEAYKNISKYYSKLKNDIDVISYELRKIGDKNDLLISEESLRQKIDQMDKMLDLYIVTRAKVESDIQYLTKNRDVIEYFKSLNKSLSDTVTELNTLNETYKSLQMKHGLNISSIEELDELLSSTNDEVVRLKYEFDNILKDTTVLGSEIDMLKVDRSTKERNLLEYMEKSNIDTLVTEYNELEKHLKDAAEIKAHYEKEHKDIHTFIFNKDDSTVYLNVVETILDKVEYIKNTYTQHEILDDWLYERLDTKQKQKEEEGLVRVLQTIEHSLNKLQAKVSYYEEKKEIAGTLTNAPKSCVNSECPLRMEAERFLDVHLNIDQYYSKLNDIQNNMTVNRQRLKELEDYFQKVTAFYTDIEELDKYVHRNNELICKFPDYMLINKFQDLFSSYMYILPRARTYIEYAYTKDRYNNVQNDMKRINELINNNKNYNSIIRDIRSDIEKINSEIEIRQTKLHNSHERYSNLRGLVSSKEAMYSDYLDFQRIRFAIVEKLRMYDRLYDTIKLVKGNYFIASYLKYGHIKLNSLVINIENNIRSLREEYNQLQYKVLKVDDYQSSLSKIEEKFQKVDILKKTWSPTTGIPLYFMEQFMETIKIYANAYLHEIWGDELKIESFNIDDREFHIMVKRIDEDYITKDVSLCSAGEVAIICTVLSLALLKSASHRDSVYTIVKLDEIDNNLDYKRRGKFVNILNGLLDEINSEQAFIITHNDEFDKDVDLILLRGSDIVKSRTISNSTTIFQF